MEHGVMRRLTGCALAVLALLGALGPMLAWAGDAASGERLFRTQCASCHSTEPGRNMIGPSLAGVYGRAYGTAPGFRYSAASRGAAVVWDEESLDKYIANPRSVLPQAAMAYPGLRNAGQRADILAYLQQVK
jgi:cytochrome c